MLEQAAVVSGFLIVAFVLVHAAVSDIASYRIRNWSLAIGAGAYLPVALVSGLPAATLVASATAALCVLAVGFALFCFNVIGAGDVKLAAVTVLWCGADQTLPFLMNTALAGGLVVIGLFFARRLAANLGMTWLSTLHSLRPGRSDIPYGVALALGGFAVLPATAWMP